MKTDALLLTLALAALSSSAAHGLQIAVGQSLLPSGDTIGLAADPASADAPDDNAYADGVRAINASRWSDAVAIFSRVVDMGSMHAEGALYWKAYAENKQGQTGTALDTCGTLRHEHPGSSWIEECGALEIEIHAKNGQPVPPKAEQSDDLKLLALASLMQHDEKKALAQIDQILNSDASEKLKQGALFIMGEHHSDTIYSQIARLSFVDGDVRIERGLDDAHQKDVTWEAAASGVPLESGYSIVTGNGRAEIELEDTSVLYLAPNSVLTINDLSTMAGAPHTDLALLSGTVSIHVDASIPGDTFLLRTPTDNLLTRYPAVSNLRLSSYLDGVAIAGLSKAALKLGLGNTSPVDLPSGQSLYFKDGRRVLDAGPIHPDDFTGWDQWVATRYAARTAAMAEVMKESGAASPLPGMADMEGEGRFYNCEPYGTCWEPTTTAGHTANATPVETASAAAPREEAEHFGPESGSAQSSTQSSPHREIHFIGPPAASGPPPQYADMGSFYPCMPGDVRLMLTRGVLPAEAQFHQPPWAWMVCNTGGWIYQNNRYVWVVGRRHHRPCAHWIKEGHTVAFVPINPRDVKNHLPVNRRAPAFAVDPKNGHLLEHVTLDNAHPVELLREPPREFRREVPMPLARAADPKMEGHQIRDILVSKGSAPRPTGIPITFDHRSQSFMMPNHALESNRISTGFAPITNHTGDLQSHFGIYNGSSSFHGGYSGSSAYHAGASGGSFHGGGSFGGSSVSHGGSVSAPSASSAASSAGSGGTSHK